MKNSIWYISVILVRQTLGVKYNSLIRVFFVCLLTAFKLPPPSSPPVPQMGQLVRKPGCAFLWCVGGRVKLSKPLTTHRNPHPDPAP